MNCKSYAALICLFVAIGLSGCDAQISEKAQPSEETKDIGYQLKTGEWLKYMDYGYLDPIGGEREALLKVKFKNSSEASLREQSIQELVTKHLLPRALRDGYETSNLYAERWGASAGNSFAQVLEQWSFELKDDWQWEQVEGPDVDWTIAQQTLVEDPELSLKVPTKFIARVWDSGAYRLELHAVSSFDQAPREAMDELISLLVRMTGCAQENTDDFKFLDDENLDAVTVFVTPIPKRDSLHLVPTLKFTFGRTDGEFTCSLESLASELDGMDWSKFEGWNDFFSR